jgi:uncharacterized protein YndB with AHSA1/START domain
VNESTEGGMSRRQQTYARVFDAPRELVWKAWTEPEQLALWWGPKGITTPLETIELDLRPGGVFRLTMVSDADGTEFPTEMEIREVVEHERIVFGWEAQRGLGAGQVTVTFTDLGDKTEVTSEYDGFTTDEIAADAEVGWNQQLERLAELLTQRNDAS